MEGAFSDGQSWLPSKFVGEADLRGRLALLSGCLRTASTEWNVQGKYGPHGEFFLFLIQKEPATVSGSETPSSMLTSALPFFSADVLKKCALIALHLIAEEGRDGDGCHAFALGDEWKMGCPKSPMWESEDEAWSEDESVSSYGSREGKVGNDALHVIGLYVPGGKISLFFEDWELAKVALSCHTALDMLRQEMHEAWWWGDATERPFVTAVLSSHRGRAATAKERNVVRGNNK